MATARLHKVQFLAPQKVRLHKVEVLTTPKTYALVRLHKVQVTATPAARLMPLESETCEPGTLIHRTASVLGGIPVDRIEWRVVEYSGLPVELLVTGAEVSFYAPSDAPRQQGEAPQVGAWVRVGAKAIKNAEESPEQTFVISTPPQTRWTGTPGSWRGSTRL